MKALEKDLATVDERKQKALELMKEFDIYKPYIDGFENKNYICVFERFGGYWAYQYPKLIQKKNEIEEKYNCTVYAITHEFTEFGELYDFLVVPQYKEDWDYMPQKENNNKSYYAFAYVWNLDDEYCSEFGDVVIQSFGGGIRRIG